MNLGIHISLQPSLDQVPLKAKALGAEAIQFFSQSPQGGTRKLPDTKVMEQFKKNMQKAGIKAAYIHAPYFINFASANNRVYYGSIHALKMDLQIASMLGIKGVITHLGSAKDFGGLVMEQGKDGAEKRLAGEAALPKVVKEKVKVALEKILDEEFTAQLFLENAAGAGAIIGSDIEQLAYFVKAVPKVGGICLDTAHAFASGVDFRQKEVIEKLMAQVEKLMGGAKLVVVHLNDSISDLGSRKDRHANWGNGLLGKETAIMMLEQKILRNKDFILETPSDEGRKSDLIFLKEERQRLGL